MNENSASLVFARHEIKYRIDPDLYPELLNRLDGLFIPDVYPESRILSIYYDTKNNDIISRSLDRPAYKEKLRLRSYGVPQLSTAVFTELKKKYRGTVYKRRAVMKCREAELFLDRGILSVPETQIIREIAYFRDFYHTMPRIFIGYDRKSFRGRNNPGLRMTFDSNIMYRFDRLSLREGDDGEMLDIGGAFLMEIKTQDCLPYDLVRILSDMRIYPCSFSKYGEIYKKTGGPDAGLRSGSGREVKGNCSAPLINPGACVSA